ncbi:Metallo-beta-lactamase family protein, RNA-specific [Lachnospiraceae bacterium TWA4]|nr:Metallo-beta-lactamase family protein, RNA-specific [Lachnospiraceae bacterium TWA4]
MKLTFIGADHEVTGSCHCLEACGKKILVDYGMEQGRDVFVNQELPFPPAEVDYVLITHTHIDHTGMLPELYAKGFRGQIISTEPTRRLSEIMLRDCAYIQESEAEWRNRKNQRSGKDPVEPVYTMNDAEGVLQHFSSCHYNEKFTLCEGIELRFVDAGHLLGSASIEVWITEEDVTKKIVFSGDIGNTDQPLIKNPTYIKEADYVVMESTYGNRSHGPKPDYQKELTEILERTLSRKGNVVVPCFAVGRTQEMLYFLRQIKQDTNNPLLKNMQVYLDSPLAVEATHIFGDGMLECYDDETLELIRQGINPIAFEGLHMTTTSTESQLLNSDPKPKVILSASGMCDAGRIRHHLKHNLWRKECTIVFAGYQAEGTLGRQLQDGVPAVKLFGEEIEVNAEITQISGISGHADNAGLMKWISSFEKAPTQVFVVHGEDAVCEIFTDRLRNELHLQADAPFSGACYDLATGQWIKEGIKEYVKKDNVTAQTVRRSVVFEKLLAAGQRLIKVIKRNEGGTNKDLAKFASQIHALCDKWDR